MDGLIVVPVVLVVAVLITWVMISIERRIK